MVLPGKLQQGQAMSSFQQNTAPKASKFSTLCVTEMKSPWAQPQAADPSAGPWATSGSQSHTPSGIAALCPVRQEPQGKVETVQKSHRSGVWPWAAAQPCGTVPPPVSMPPAPSTGPAHGPGLRPEGRVRRRRFSILLRHFPVWLQQRFPSQHSTSWPSVAILTTAPRPDTTRSIRNGPVLLYPSQIPFFPLPAPAWLPCSYCAAYRNAFCGNYTLS